MSEYRYVRMDPTGNITCLVLDSVKPEEEPRVTRALLAECEQVAYLETPVLPGAAAAIRLMGGEFCGNAAMASAAWLVRDQLRDGEETTVPLQVSGAAAPVLCRIRAAGENFEGTVEMPRILDVREEKLLGLPLTRVRMEGITHLILTGEEPERAEAEQLLTGLAQEVNDEAVGLLIWNEQEKTMRPLVWVRGSGSMVWENGCGSGSAAVGAAEALKAGGRVLSPIRQPGGVIRAEAEAEAGQVKRVSITGLVRLGPVRALRIGAE